MQYIFFLFISLLMVVPAVSAEDKASNTSLINLFDVSKDDSSTESIVSKKTNVDDVNSVKEKDEEDSIFSFLNFKTKKKEATTIEASDSDKLQQIKRLASSGDINAQLSLAYMYLYGDKDSKIEPDFNKAFNYYLLAAKQNDPVALNNLGSLFYSGIGIKKNTEKAALLFDRSVKLGNADAAVNLAFMYVSGNGIQKDIPKAIKLFKMASENNNPAANFMYGYALYKGINGDKNYTEAAKLIKSSADNKFDEAQLEIAKLYMEGHGLPQNYGNAVKYLNNAVSQGNVEAMYILGEILTAGKKYSKDYFTAHIMFNLAAVRGAQGAKEARETIGSALKIAEVLQAQEKADKFVEKPSDISLYIHRLFGPNVKWYLDSYSSSQMN